MWLEKVYPIIFASGFSFFILMTIKSRESILAALVVVMGFSINLFSLVSLFSSHLYSCIPTLIIFLFTLFSVIITITSPCYPSE